MTQEPSLKSRRGRSARFKGHSFERLVSKMFQKALPWFSPRRNLEYQKEAAVDGVDLVGTGRWKFQCKRGKRYAALTAIEEIKSKPGDPNCPILVTKADHKPILAVLPFEELLELIAFKERHENVQKSTALLEVL